MISLCAYPPGLLGSFPHVVASSKSPHSTVPRGRDHNRELHERFCDEEVFGAARPNQSTYLGSRFDLVLFF
jgi:hypothetical protein